MTSPEAVDIFSLLRQAKRHAERPALTFYRGKALEGRLSYDELVTCVEELAGGLYERFGLGPGERVAILAYNQLEIPVLVLAVLRLGAVVVPLNPNASPDDWTFILKHSGARGLCVSRELASRVPQEAQPSFVLSIEEVSALRGRAPVAPGQLVERTGVILYTSGTTGSPKGVALRQRNLISNAWSMARNFQLRGTTQFAVLPLYHAHAFGFGLMTALSTGGHLVFAARLEPFAWAHVIRAESVEVSSVVPTQLPLLLSARVSRNQVPTLRHLLVSSSPLASRDAGEFERSTQIPLIQGWGLTEYTNFACCASPFSSIEEHAHLMFSWEVPSIGPALEGTEVCVVDASGARVPEGTRGELVIRGHSMMEGYFRDPDSTARTIDPAGWLHSGDEGFFRTHRGEPIFFVTGRLKELIIRDAEKYSPLRLERRLLETLPELAGRLAVLGFPHREHGEEIGAYIEAELLEDAVRTRLSAAIDAMPVMERPRVVLHGPEPIPRTHTGKVQRRKMQPWFANWISHRGRTVIERALPPASISS